MSADRVLFEFWKNRWLGVRSGGGLDEREVYGVGDCEGPGGKCDLSLSSPAETISSLDPMTAESSLVGVTNVPRPVLDLHSWQTGLAFETTMRALLQVNC